MGGIKMENIKIEIPKIPTFKISIPQYGTGAGTSITVDSEMSDTSTNPAQNKVVKGYVDGELLPKIELWQPNTLYKKDMLLLGTRTKEGKSDIVIFRVADDYTSSAIITEDFLNNHLMTDFIVNSGSENVDLSDYVKKVEGCGLAKISEIKSPDGKVKNQIAIASEGGGLAGSVIVPAYTSDLTDNVGFVKSSELKTEIEKIFPNGDEVRY